MKLLNENIVLDVQKIYQYLLTEKTKLENIPPKKYGSKHFYNIKLTSQEYICNMAICKALDAEDT